MKKIQSYAIAFAALAFGLASCATEGATPVGPDNADEGNAYVSVKIVKQPKSRASSELAGHESDLNSVYIVTFDENGTIVKIPDGGYFIPITGTIPTTILAQKVGASTDKIMVVANPGTNIMAALTALTQGSTYTVFNEAIAGVKASEVELADGSFTMISSPVDEDLEEGDRITTALIDVDPAVVGDGAGEYTNEQNAKDAANLNPIPVGLERIASKLFFKAVGSPVVKPSGASFEFTSWTVDAVNSTFFPYASRTLFDTNHTGSFYTYNFYTEDPNFADKAPYHNDGSIKYTTVNRTFAGKWEPVLLWDDYYDWMNDTETGTESNNVAYLVENTMAAAAQRYGNATRVVIKGKYAPAGFTLGDDWFRFGGRDYKTLELLKAAYTIAKVPATADAALVAACDAFLAQVKIGNPAITTDDFATLTQAELNGIEKNGGEVAKVPADGVGIRWFQKSVNYWFYEIRHDAEITGTMAFGKYGVVRNNWYNLSLDEVASYGTPWYPDLINPGDGDPNPQDPIDSKYGYIGITITPANWVVWENSMKI